MSGPQEWNAIRRRPVLVVVLRASTMFVVFATLGFLAVILLRGTP